VLHLKKNTNATVNEISLDNQFNKMNTNTHNKSDSTSDIISKAICMEASFRLRFKKIK